MAEYLLRDRPQELWTQIEQLHLTYLQTEDVPEKHDLRKKLEGIILDFVSLVPHNRKFCFRETANVLHRSAATKDDFTGYGASSAWAALALYASNILSQPWRKEYRELELYCGFYKHEIAANLVGAEILLEEMGYKHTGQMTMVMDWPIDPDQVTYVSRDSLIAFVECQLLKKIWEEVSLNFPCTWLEILEYRETHVGTWDQAVQGLIYRYRQRHYLDQQQQQQQLAAAAYHHDVYGAARFHQPPVSSCVYGAVPPAPHGNYCNYNTYGGAMTNGYGVPPRYVGHPLPVQPAMPAYAVPVSNYATYHHPAQPVLKPHDQYPVNGHHAHASAVGIAAHHPTASNGYGTPGHPPYGYSVPTAQLIELDPATPPQSNSSESQLLNSPTDSSTSMVVSRAAARQTQTRKNATVDKQRSHKSELERAKDDGTGTFDSWDYVYRNLESQGLKKNVGDRPDVLSTPHNRKGVSTLPNTVEESRKKLQQKNQELEQALMNMRLAEFERTASSQAEPRPLKFNEVLHKIRLEGDGEPARVQSSTCKGGVSAVDGCESVYDNMSPPNEKAIIIVPSKPTSVNQSNKATTKTLPRESSHYRSEKNASKFSSTTMDPRRVSDRSKQKQISNSSSMKEINRYNDDAFVWQDDVSPATPSSDTAVEAVSRLMDPSVVNNNVKWECITCTYINAASHDVCEMCGKSKTRGPEVRPLASGGRECPQCTLVNEKGIGTCDACGTSLKGSPTYI